MKTDIQPRKLTEANVRGLPPATERGYVVRDTELKGFIVIVNKKSSSWAVQRDLWQGPPGHRRLVRSIRHTLGRVGIMPLRVAREKALEAIHSFSRAWIPISRQRPRPIHWLINGRSMRRRYVPETDPIAQLPISSTIFASFGTGSICHFRR